MGKSRNSSLSREYVPRPIKEKKIKKLTEEFGWSRWQKGDYDRIYADMEDIGLKVKRDRRGIIREGYFVNSDYRYSLDQLRSLAGAKAWVDVKTGEVWMKGSGEQKILSNLKTVLETGKKIQ